MSTQNPSWRRVPTLLSYGVAVTSVLVVLPIMQVLQAYWGSFPRSPLFMSAIILSTWYGGFMLGMVATCLAVLALDYYYVHAVYTVKLGLSYLPPLVVFSLSALFVSWITARPQRAEHALRKVRDELEVTVQERTAALRRTNAELQAEIAERQQAEEALRQAQAELVHVTRVMTMGELTASIAHEVNQPLAAVITNGNACLRWLARQTPNLEEVRAAVERIIREGKRASEVIRRLRALARKIEPQKAWLAINDVIQEVITLVYGEVRKHQIALQTELSAALPPALGDRVQLQQVILNLVINGIEAMHDVTDRPRELRIRSRRQDAEAVLVAVQDAGSGLDPQSSVRLFDPFFTTKPGGMGLGLSISRTIIEAHGGRLWATPNDGPGATV